MGVWEYLKSLFENHVFVILGVIWATISSFLFPEAAYLTAAGAVLGMMMLDLVTKIYSLARQEHGLRRAIRNHRILSNKFAKGTTDKLLIFGVMLVICGFAYRITPIATLSTWFMQIVFTLMFLRDALSIIENLMDAGVSGLSIFKKIVKKKMDDYIKAETEDKPADTTNPTDYNDSPRN